MSGQVRTTGGPAYPGQHTYIDGMAASYEGMNLRDHFAAHAVTGLLAANAMYGGKTNNHQALAADAYAVADALIAHKFETDPKPRDLGDDLPF